MIEISITVFFMINYQKINTEKFALRIAVKILLLAELDSTELADRVEAQKIGVKNLAEGNALIIFIVLEIY